MTSDWALQPACGVGTRRAQASADGRSGPVPRAVSAWQGLMSRIDQCATDASFPGHWEMGALAPRLRGDDRVRGSFPRRRGLSWRGLSFPRRRESRASVFTRHWEMGALAPRLRGDDRAVARPNTAGLSVLPDRVDHHTHRALQGRARGRRWPDGGGHPACHHAGRGVRRPAAGPLLRHRHLPRRSRPAGAGVRRRRPGPHASGSRLTSDSETLASA